MSFRPQPHVAKTVEENVAMAAAAPSSSVSRQHQEETPIVSSDDMSDSSTEDDAATTTSSSSALHPQVTNACHVSTQQQQEQQQQCIDEKEQKDEELVAPVISSAVTTITTTESSYIPSMSDYAPVYSTADVLSTQGIPQAIMDTSDPADALLMDLHQLDPLEDFNFGNHREDVVYQAMEKDQALGQMLHHVLEDYFP